MNYLAIDLGAESGRVILGSLNGDQLTLEEIQRFPNIPIRRDRSILWNLTIPIREALQKTDRKNLPIRSISADSWGVDYCLFDGATGKMMDEPHHYRDPRTNESSREFLSKVPWETIFAETGIQYMPINTLFQLASEDPLRLHQAGLLLSIADRLNYALGGEPVIEESMASTFQIYNPRTRDWSDLLLRNLGLRRATMPKVVPPGTVIGHFKNLEYELSNFEHTKIIATCSHDTGCAVAAVPATGKNWAYLSSGTWSLMGVEIPPQISDSKFSILNSQLNPIINDTSRALNFTNEIGYGSTVRLLKNISGLWLLQECRRAWTAGGQNFDYAELTRLAESEPPTHSVIDPMDPRFLAPASMPEAIADYCREKNLPVPATPAQYTRCIFESLAQLYAKTLHQLEQLTGEKIERLHIVGGGSKNNFLNQLTANACQIEIHAGPVEATALGNIIIQAITSGEIKDHSAARQLIAKNFPARIFIPL